MLIKQVFDLKKYDLHINHKERKYISCTNKKDKIYLGNYGLKNCNDIENIINIDSTAINEGKCFFDNCNNVRFCQAIADVKKYKVINSFLYIYYRNRKPFILSRIFWKFKRLIKGGY